MADGVDRPVANRHRTAPRRSDHEGAGFGPVAAAKRAGWARPGCRANLAAHTRQPVAEVFLRRHPGVEVPTMANTYSGKVM